MVQFLATVPVFDHLDVPALEELAKQLESVYFPAGSAVMAQGDPGDCMWLVVSGRVRVSVDQAGGPPILTEFSRGEALGEIALLTERPRAASVHTVRDSHLLRLPAASFARLVQRRPAMLRAVSRVLVDRLSSAAGAAVGTGARSLTVVPAGRSRPACHDLSHGLTTALTRVGTAMRLDAEAVDRALGPGGAQRNPNDPGWGELISWLHAVESDNDQVVYQAEPEDSPWTRLCLRQADVILLAAPPGGDPTPGRIEETAITEGHTLARRQLVIIHPPAAAVAWGTSRWLAGRPVEDHHHVRLGYAADYARLARLVTGRACGLVLGGGGARGFAHLGALQALEQVGIPIDVVGGTSIGAVMGALYAQGLSHADRVKRFEDGLALRGSLAGVTLPLVSISSSKKINRLLSTSFGDTAIEDLWTRYFCISNNLSRAEEVVHDQGELKWAVRASLSMPGAFPPVYSDGDLLVDGGVLNNLPVDVMRARIGRGTIVAVDLFRDVELRVAQPFGPGLSGWNVLLRRVNPFVAPLAVPSLLEVIHRSQSLASARSLRRSLAREQVDLLIRPPTGQIRALDFHAGPPLIEIAYRHTLDALKESSLIERTW